MKAVRIAVALAALWGASVACADAFADLRKHAEELRQQGNDVAALEAFTKAAAVAPDDAVKSEVLEQAAYCTFRQRHKDPSMREKAMELANRIPLRPMSVKCRMVLLKEDYKYGDLIKTFKDEDIASWEDKELAAEALSLRANAYSALRRGQEAKTDMTMAVQCAPGNPKYRLGLAHIYRSRLKDDEQALELYRGILAEAEPTTVDDEPYLTAALETAAILRDHARYQEALEALDPIKDMTALNSFEKVRALRAFGEIYAVLGRADEAVAAFDKANELQGR